MAMGMVPMRSRKQLDVCSRGIVPALKASVLLAAFAGAGGVWAQTVEIRPSVQTRLTWTDNGAATHDKESDWVTEVTPGVVVARNSSRLRGLLNAQLRNVAYANGTGKNTSFLSLQGRAEVEPVEDMLFVDFSGVMSRNNMSAFSGRSSNDDFNTDKNDETRTWTIAPRLEFKLGGSGAGLVSYMSRWYDSGSSSLQGERFEQWQARLGNPAPGSMFGWDVNYSRSETTYDQSINQKATQDIGRATLFVNVAPQFRLRVIGGHESSDYGTARQSQSDGIYGGGFDWTPSERTAVTAIAENRVFGTGYNFSAQHRAPRSIWRLSYSKDVTSSAQNFGGGIYDDALFQQFFNSADLIAQFPDAVQRESYVRSLLGYPATGLVGDVRTNSYFLSRTLRGGVNLIGARNTVTFSFQDSERSRLSSLAGLSADDDFARASTIKTRSLTAALSHRLSGTSSLTSSLTGSHSEGAGATGPETRRMTAMVGMTTQLGPKAVGGLSYRYQRSDSDGSDNDFSENAITANLGLRF